MCILVYAGALYLTVVLDTWDMLSQGECVKYNAPAYTSIHIQTHTYIHTYIYTYIHTHTHTPTIYTNRYKDIQIGKAVDRSGEGRMGCCCQTSALLIGFQGGLCAVPKHI
jgi:hypothetical protein